MLQAVCDRAGDRAVYLPLKMLAEAGPGVLEGLASRELVCLDDVGTAAGDEAWELGYQILSIIRDNPEFKYIPVIMLTSKDGIINRVKGKVAGSSAYLTKPFDPAQLVETIERYIK